MMPMEKTLSILKPDSVADNHIGEIIARFEKNGLSVVAAKMVHLSVDQAKAFYAVHAQRGFFMELVNFMIEGPVLVMVLEGDNAVMKNRTIMGATNPKDAAPGTVRADFAQSIERNAVHGSDSLENAVKEISFFFKPEEIFSRKLVNC
jgi:nucleoside-diphosphate kinase